VDDYGIDASKRNPWYFPTIWEYSSLLEKHGFTVAFAHFFNRPTALSDGERGMDHWLDSFADDFFLEFSNEERVAIYRKIKEKVKPEILKEGKWEADCKRLRMIAIKQ